MGGHATLGGDGAGGIGTTGTPFPGFGGIPPAVALAGSAGIALEASRSDHTHAFTFPVYAPGLAGMQRSGLLQQTYAAPNATPVVTTMGARLVPYGINTGTGLLTTNGRVTLDDSISGNSPQMAILGSVATSSLVAGSLPAQFQTIDEGSSSSIGILAIANFTANSTVSPRHGFRRSRGTFAAPTVVSQGSAGIFSDYTGQFAWTTHSGTSYISSVRMVGYVDRAGTLDATHVPQNVGFWFGVAGASANLNQSNADQNLQHVFGYNGDAVLGYLSIATIATSGFVWTRSMAGPPTGVPVVVKGVCDTAGTTAIPTVMDSVNFRLYGNFGGTWKSVQFA